MLIAIAVAIVALAVVGVLTVTTDGAALIALGALAGAEEEQHYKVWEE